MTKIQKQDRLLKYAIKELQLLGAIKSDNHYQYQLDTKLGKVSISFDKDTIHHTKPVTISIFTRFDEPERAVKEIYAVNKHSGKWNHLLCSLYEINYVIGMTLEGICTH